MDQSRRAVESYWRSRMIDGATSDEDKVTPVYKLEEICELLRSSHVSIVKEVSQFILKRLEHKSPIVKQKALRVIKYAVGKSGADFKREMQRNSAAIRQLIHYRGQPDPLKGEALNKAVRETAQEALSMLFSSDDSKAAPTESNLRGRIQGFGSTNYEMPSEDKKSFISEVVDIGSSTIKQGLSNLAQSPSLRKSNSGSYKSPNLQRSLTGENDNYDQYEGIGSRADTYNSSRFSQNAGSASWGQNAPLSQSEVSNGDSSSTYSQKTREEKLLETIVTSGGVRLQPTRDALNIFIVEASKLDALSLGQAIETKLRAPMWQVRMKTICVLEAVLRKKEDKHFSEIASYFGDNKEAVVQCAESPQASLREKATKVLSLLGGEQVGGVNHVEKSLKTSQPSVMPDLIDTGETDDDLGVEDSRKTDTDPNLMNAAASTAPLIDVLLGDNFGGGESANGHQVDEDPFADVSFHTSHNKSHDTDLFSGIPASNSGATESQAASHTTASEPFDLFSFGSEAAHENCGKDAANLMDGLSINGNDSFMNKDGSNNEKDSKNVDSLPSDKKFNNAFNSEFPSQAAGMSANPMFPLGTTPYNFPSGLMFNPAFASQPMNYGAMGNVFAQQQFLATLSNFQQQGGLQSNTSINVSGALGGNSAPLPDIFNPGLPTQPPTSTMSGSRKEDTKAFDFISDHLASSRDPKRVI